MQGLSGNDTYIVDNTGDRIFEAVNAGIDTVQSSVTYTLAANLEKLVLTGTNAINGTGNALANVLTGNGAANTLAGGDGADLLEGKAGNDILTGGLGADAFLFNKAGQGIDLVRDFSRAQGDKLQVHASDYGLAVGTLASDWFETSASGLATKAHAEFVFNSGSHTLSWDADGIGSAAAIQVATFSNNPLLQYQDFAIVV
ncbi:type I secretion protein [Methylobacterium sp. V23]|nr:type I secretion protein [Methylobacterium sp. V23]